MKLTACALIFMIVIPTSHDMAAVAVNDNHKNQEKSVSSQKAEPALCFPPQQVFTVVVTAYSIGGSGKDGASLTASGIRPKEGIIAANFLPFGTRIQMPKLFGNRVFTVADRMHRRKKQWVDIWMPTSRRARIFGIKRTKLIVLSNSNPS